MKFETIAIRHPLNRTQHKEHSSAIYPTSSFVFDNARQMAEAFAGENDLNIYSRFTNPSVREFELKMAALEGTEDAFGTATGMAAVFATLMAFLEKGDHIIAGRSLFGSTFQIFADTLPKYGIDSDFVEPDNIESWEKFITPKTKMVYIETPTNPGLEIIDLAAAGKFANAHNLILVVDNCFATPYLQQPLKYGSDLILHSATKHIDGQGRVLGGVVCGSEELIEKIKLFCRRTGPALSPFNAWVLSKSLETLAVRMDRHCANAEKIAGFLDDHKAVEWVRYPFHKNHPQKDIAIKQMSAGGGIVCFEIKAGPEGQLKSGEEFLNALEMISLTANLGDTRSIATHPASTTHLRVASDARSRMGITDGLIRISVGLEHIDDIIADIDQAL